MRTLGVIGLVLSSGCAALLDTDSLRPAEDAPLPYLVQPRWLRTIGGPTVDEGRACAFDSAGRVYLAGTTQAGASAEDLGEVANAGANDALLAVYSGDGTGLYLDSRGGTGGDGLRDIAIVGDSVYLAGFFGATVDFGGGPMTTTSGVEALIVSRNVSGELNWIATGYGAGPGVAHGIDARDGRVYATGYFGKNEEGSLDDIGFAGCGSRTAADSSSGWIAAFDDFESGNCLWLEVIDSPGSDQGSAVRVGPDATSPIIVGGRTAGLPLSNPLNHDLWLGELNTFGATLWTFNPEAPDGFEEAVDVVATDANSCAVGRFSSPIAFDRQQTIDPGPGRDGFVTCSERGTGTHQWTRNVGASIEARLDGVDATGGMLVAAGSFEGQLDIDQPTLVAQGVRDALVLALDNSDGTLLAATSFGGTGTVLTHDVAIGDAAICVAGNFDGELRVGDEQRTSTDSSTDAFLAVFDLVRQE